MPIILPIAFAEISVQVTRGFDGNVLTNVFGAKLDLPLDQSAVDEISDAIGTAYKDWLPSSWLYNGIHVLEGPTPDPLAWDSTEGAGVGTTTPAPEASPQVMLLIRKQSPISGRQHRGRTFIAPMHEDEVGPDGVIDSGEVTRLQSFADDLMAALSGAHLDGMYILHQTETAPTEVTSYTAENKVATLRRRYQR